MNLYSVTVQRKNVDEIFEFVEFVLHIRAENASQAIEYAVEGSEGKLEDIIEIYLIDETASSEASG